jgi:hypothetical protein
VGFADAGFTPQADCQAGPFDDQSRETPGEQFEFVQTDLRRIFRGNGLQFRPELGGLGQRSFLVARGRESRGLEWLRLHEGTPSRAVFLRNKRRLSWTVFSRSERLGTMISLVVGQHVPIKLEFCRGSGGAGVRLDWSFPGQPFEVIPRRYFSVNP